MLLDSEDHRMMTNEWQCVDAARLARLRLVRAKKEKGIPFEAPFGDVKWTNVLTDPSLSVGSKIVAVAVALALFVPMALLTVVVYFQHLIESRREMTRIKQELLWLDVPTPSHSIPGPKTLESLWWSNGIKPDDNDDIDCLELIVRWVEILFGPDRVTKSELNARLEIIRAARGAANRRFRQLKSAPHFYFGPAVSDLICQLSNELGPYCVAECRQAMTR